MFRKSFVLLCLCSLAAGVAHAQPPERAEELIGTVTKSTDGHPVSGAQISVFSRGLLLQKAPSAANGKFIVAPLLMAASRMPGTSYNVFTRAEGYAPSLLTITPGLHLAPVEIKLTPEVPLAMRAVTSSGAPVSGAEIQVLGFDPRPFATRKQRPGVVVTNYQIDNAHAVTGANGTAQLHDMPLVGTISLGVNCEGYAGVIQNIDAETRSPVLLTLSRETTVTGRVLFGDTKEAFALPGVSIRAQLAGTYYAVRQAELGADGAYQLHDIPSLESAGGTALALSLYLGAAHEEPLTGPGLSARYVEFRRNHNIFVTREIKGVTRWYLGYAETGRHGLHYKEGEKLQHDVLLQPLGRITGTLPAVGATTPRAAEVRISYDDPRSSFGTWSVVPDANGHFEIFAPPGDITLNIEGMGRRRTVLVPGLKAQETREIQVP